MKIYVGNLSYDTREEQLREAFAPYGSVGEATVITDRETGRSRGFGFVEIADDDAARTAIQSLNGTALDGRNVTVNEARPRTERPRSSANRSW
jgi:RNA recognition motif-containing protein